MPGKTNRKHRRNKDWCERYQKTGRQELNKLIKLARHQKEHPNDRPVAKPTDYTRRKPLNYWEKQNKLKNNSKNT